MTDQALVGSKTAPSSDITKVAPSDIKPCPPTNVGGHNESGKVAKTSSAGVGRQVSAVAKTMPTVVKTPSSGVFGPVSSTLANDWQYICVGCGEIVMAGADFVGNCPKCRGSRWLCHWLSKDHDSRKRCTTEKGAINSHDGIMLPNKLHHNPLNDDKNGGTENHHRGRGQPEKITRELLKPFRRRGLGCKRIARELEAQGIKVHWMTVSRHLNRR